MSIHNYTLRQAVHPFETGSVLVKDGSDCFCPFAQPVMVPMQQSAIQINQNQANYAPMRVITCCTGCPMATVAEIESNSGEKAFVYETSCGHQKQVFNLQGVELVPADQQEEKPVSKLVKLP